MIAPSVLSMDFSKMESSLQLCQQGGAKWIHYDVMDGHFVDNLTFGATILKGIRQLTPLFLDVHLMIQQPARYLEDYVNAGADQITVHIECFEQPAQLFDFIAKAHALGVKVGLTSKPKTAIEQLVPYLANVDLVLVMSVEPGFGGQAFMPEALSKIAFFNQYREQHACHYLIEVDGGINAETAKMAKDHGCDVLVAGSYIFKKDIVQQIQSLL